MSKLILEEWISLDGYATGKDGKLDFFAPHVRTSYESEERMEFREGIDTILMGTKTYRQFSAMWPGRTAADTPLATKMNSARKVVFSSSLTEALWGAWEPAEIINSDAVAAISEMRSTAKERMIVWGSISLAQSLIQAGIVDEYHIHVCPILTGGGRKLFDNELATSLTLIDCRTYGPGIAHMHYKC